MIPEAKQTAVAHALHTAFGVSEFEDISQLTAGLSSALIFRIVVRGKPYLLRVITRTDAMANPSRYYACMKVAAEAGLAPQVWYTGTEDRISITDFVDAKPFPIDKARVLMPDLLNRLHSLPRFPSRINYLNFADNTIRKIQASKILPESIAEDVFQRYERINSVYPRNDQDLVSCHNDLKPDNVLFDGERAWFVDWEGAFLNDRYTELAVVANFVVTDDNEEKDYLQRYFGDDVTGYQRARFFLMRQWMHMIYCCFFLSLCTADGRTIDLNIINPGFRKFHNSLWEGKINLLDKYAQQQYAWVHLEQVKHNLKMQRFDDALRIVSDHPLS